MIKNITYDFGYVLAYPRTGNWFIPPNFWKVLGISGCLLFVIKFYKIGQSFYKAHKYLDENHLLFTEKEEYNQFTEFYRRILTDMGLRKKKIGHKAKLLAYDTVCNDRKVVFYDDVLNEIQRAGANYKTAVMSDTWPSLKRLFDHKGITKLLNGLVMSCDFGICKDNIEFFHKAAAKLDFKPEETAFIDDSETNLDNAAKSGYFPIRMDRYGKVKSSKYPLIHCLSEALLLVDKYNKAEDNPPAKLPEVINK